MRVCVCVCVLLQICYRHTVRPQTIQILGLGYHLLSVLTQSEVVRFHSVFNDWPLYIFSQQAPIVMVYAFARYLIDRTTLCYMFICIVLSPDFRLRQCPTQTKQTLSCLGPWSLVETLNHYTNVIGSDW